MTFILMLILMAKGYTITRGRLRTVTVIKIAAFTVVYIILYLGVFVWEVMVSDISLTIFVHRWPIQSNLYKTNLSITYPS